MHDKEKLCTELLGFTSLFNELYSKEIHQVSRARHISTRYHGYDLLFIHSHQNTEKCTVQLISQITGSHIQGALSFSQFLPLRSKYRELQYGHGSYGSSDCEKQKSQIK